PAPVDMEPIRAVTRPDYLTFLETAWSEWKGAGHAGEILATSIPARRMQLDRPPRTIDGKAGYYCLALETAITGGTWRAVLSSAASAQSALMEVLGGARAAFALCRPPGHHATADMYGGYCFINNAAMVAEMWRAAGAEK
ncbi:histone deacetylase family protein, partial [Thioclava sp. BHET1]